MIDKRVIVVIVIFIIGGLFIYSFANPLESADGEYHENNNTEVPSEKDNNDKQTEKIDQTALDDIKKEFLSLNEDDYTEESWKFLQEQIKEAEKKKTQEEFDQFVSQISFDVLSPKPTESLENNDNNQSNSSGVQIVNPNPTRPNTNNTINKNGLNSLKVLANSYNRNDYTESSYKALTDALNLPENTQAQVNTKTSAIQKAIQNLKPKTTGNQTVNKSALNNLKIEVAKRNKDDYTTESWQKVVDASNLPENTQTQVDVKINAIQTALNNLQLSSYTVVFNADNGSNHQTAIVKYNNKVNQPTNPIKDGYKFLGWYANNSLFNFDTNITSNLTLTARWQKRPTTAIFGTATNEPAQVQAIVNGNQVRYKGEMQEKSPITYDNSTYYNYIRIKVSAPDNLSEEEYNKLRLVYQGRTYGKEQFERNSVTGATYFEILQPFSPNYGSSASNSLTTINFEVYWGYGTTTNYNVTFDIVVHENGTI